MLACDRTAVVLVDVVFSFGMAGEEDSGVGSHCESTKIFDGGG